MVQKNEFWETQKIELLESFKLLILFFMRAKKWAREHDFCINCGKNTNKHKWHWLCINCYDSKRSQEEARKKVLKMANNKWKAKNSTIDWIKSKTARRIKKWLPCMSYYNWIERIFLPFKEILDKPYVHNKPKYKARRKQMDEFEFIRQYYLQKRREAKEKKGS